MLYNPIPIIITLAGGYLLLKLRAFFLLHPIRSFRCVFGALKERDNFRSFTLALAGTLGVGNVLGVAVGIILGGAGSLFWLLVSALFSSALKYAEVTLSEDSRDMGHGGMFYLVRATFSRVGGVLSVLYAICCLALGLVMGAALQSHSVSGICGELFNTPPTLPTIILAIIVLLTIVGGSHLISKITSVAIPLSTIIYIILTTAVIILNIARLPVAIQKVLSDAFSTDAVCGGIVGFLLSSSLREGYSRGVLSNEAGAGTSTIAHATGTSLSAGTRGVLGILEVVFDTVILCMLTGLAILVAVPNATDFSSGTMLIHCAITGTLGTWSGLPLLLSILVFAYSTILCWYYYSEECVRQIIGRRVPIAVVPVFLVFVVMGGVIGEALLVYSSDVLLLFLVLISVPTLIKNSDRLLHLSERSGLLKSKETNSR